MISIICDFCSKPINCSTDKVTVTVEPEVAKIGWDPCAQYHFHSSCMTRLKNKVNTFIAEQKETKQ